MSSRSVGNDAPVLREWSYTPNGEPMVPSPPVEGVAREDTPPVAPAVVLPSWLNDGSQGGVPAAVYESGTPRSPQYPVATFVNLVRNSIDQITAYAITENHQNDGRPGSHIAAAAESTRSADVRAALSRQGHSTRSIMSEADLPRMAEGGGELLIVDDNLVSVHREETEHQPRRSRMGKRFRGIKKWIAKRARAYSGGNNNNNNNNNNFDARSTSPLRGGTTFEKKKKKKEKKKKRQQTRTLLLPPSLQTSEEFGQSADSADRASERRAISPAPDVWAPPPEMMSAAPDAVSERSHPMVAMQPLAMTSNAQSTSSAVNADFLGTADQLGQASAFAAAPADYIGSPDEVADSPFEQMALAEVAFVENMDHNKKDDYGTAEKVKQEEIALDSMLQQARHETCDDDNAIETSTEAESEKPHAKVDTDSKPLSEASPRDKHVWNDTLKVIVVGNTVEKSAFCRALAGKKPKRRKENLSVDVHTYSPNLRFSIWDVNAVNAGAHPATQSLFFSSGSLYVLLWDLARWNGSTFVPTKAGHAKDGDVSDDEDNGVDDFQLEEMRRAADRALQLDIEDRVLSWLDSVITPGSAILPVVMVSDGMSDYETRRRCSMLQLFLIQHPIFEGEDAAKLVFGKDSILRVNLELGSGLHELQDVIQEIAKEQVFDHVRSHIPSHVVTVLDKIRLLKENHKIILLDHLMSELNIDISVEEVKEALYFLSNIGEVLYYGNSTDEILSRYIILSRQWLVSALRCILRPDLQRELDETRRMMRLQFIYSGETFEECDVVQTLLRGTNSSCPIISQTDSAMLWQSMSFIRDAADHSAQLSEASTTMYDFLERLLVYSGILLPLAVSGKSTYFVPSLLDKTDPSSVWTYKTSESWMTTLCHSWLLREGAPPNIMEHVTVCLLQDLYEYSHAFHGRSKKASIHHASSYPLGMGDMKEFSSHHCNEAVGRVRIHQVMCWQSSMLVKIGTVFTEPGQTELRESHAEIYVALVDEQSDHCVATKSMSSGMKRLIVCGKGQVGHHGRKLWKGGYGLVLDSIKVALADFTGIDRQVVCPECLAYSHPSIAKTWSWDNVKRSIAVGNGGVRCDRGHLVDCNLLCGTCTVNTPKIVSEPHQPLSPDTTKVRRSVTSILPSVVVVGLWDEDAGVIQSVGSGFVVDKKNGLVVTAGHVLFNMAEGEEFGKPYFGIENAKAVIGFIPEDDHDAVFRYYATIVAHDVNKIDACVLRITERFENDVDGENCSDVAAHPLEDVRNEDLLALKLTRQFELEESVRIIGFNQGGEGRLEVGKHVNRTVDFAKGYICKKFINMLSDDDSSCSSTSISSGTPTSFNPNEEIVVMCPTISGHSGGPCVNEEGKVVGILSRADPVDRQRCYVVPSSELRTLLRSARQTVVHTHRSATM